ARRSTAVTAPSSTCVAVSAPVIWIVRRCRTVGGGAFLSTGTQRYRFARLPPARRRRSDGTTLLPGREMIRSSPLSATDNSRRLVSAPFTTSTLFSTTTAGERLVMRSEEHTSELQSPYELVCR